MNVAVQVERRWSNAHGCKKDVPLRSIVKLMHNAGIFRNPHEAKSLRSATSKY